MPVIIGIIVIVMLWFGYVFMSSSDEPESVKTEIQLIEQETQSTNEKLKQR